ncbi:hypothetical protein L7F22_054680 [Adiantum nelumboides]|nr:hypothetical protein [Adiantum nelumboides]
MGIYTYRRPKPCIYTYLSMMYLHVPQAQAKCSSCLSCACTCIASLILGLTSSCFYPFCAACELAERIAFFAVGANLGTYIVFQYHIFPSEAATLITNWVASAYVLCVLGGFLADAYWGRFYTILGFLWIYVVDFTQLLLEQGASKQMSLHLEPISTLHLMYMSTKALHLMMSFAKASTLLSLIVFNGFKMPAHVIAQREALASHVMKTTSPFSCCCLTYSPLTI